VGSAHGCIADVCWLTALIGRNERHCHAAKKGGKRETSAFNRFTLTFRRSGLWVCSIFDQSLFSTVKNGDRARSSFLQTFPGKSLPKSGPWCQSEARSDRFARVAVSRTFCWAAKRRASHVSPSRTLTVGRPRVWRVSDELRVAMCSDVWLSTIVMFIRLTCAAGRTASESVSGRIGLKDDRLSFDCKAKVKNFLHAETIPGISRTY